MRVVVAGGAGFLGSHLCDRLLSLGHQVYCLDDFSTGETRNIAAAVQASRFDWKSFDIADGFWQYELDPTTDAVVNFACHASLQAILADPVKTLLTCSHGTYNLLDEALRLKARFLMASTSEVYGDPKISPQHESYWGNVNPVGERSVYDEGKRFAESLVTAYHKYHGLDSRIMRIFNVYGPRMKPDDGRVVANFIGQALRGNPITVYGDGSQTRSLCYVDDFIDGAVGLLMAGELPGIHSPVNIGNTEEITVLELAKKIIDITASKSRIEFRPLPQDDPKVRKPDIGRITGLINWKPKTSLEHGLNKTIEYYREA